MKIRNLVAATGIATMSATASFAAVVDLGFLMDESGSVTSGNYSLAMNALADALDANIPVNDPNFTYRISVVSFADSADVSLGVRTITDQASLDSLVADIRTEAGDFTGGLTNYNAAFAALNTQFGDVDASGSVASLINMTTDGVPTSGGAPDTTTLRANGWDSLSFEAIGSGPNTGSLSALAFDLNGVGGAPVIGDANLITDPLTDSFVLTVSDYTQYSAAINTKVQRTVTPQVPLPAGMPLMIAGLAAFGVMRRRQKAA